MTQINMEANHNDSVLINKIVARAAKAPNVHSPLDLAMDITAVHLNGCPLDLDRLLAADDANFFHDIYGIIRHIDRNTGELLFCFLPRFAARKEPSHEA